MHVYIKNTHIIETHFIDPVLYIIMIHMLKCTRIHAFTEIQSHVVHCNISARLLFDTVSLYKAR